MLMAAVDVQPPVIAHFETRTCDVGRGGSIDLKNGQELIDAHEEVHVASGESARALVCVGVEHCP